MAMFGHMPGAFPASGAEAGPPPGYGWFWGMMGGPGGAPPGAIAHAGHVPLAGPGAGDESYAVVGEDCLWECERL